MDHQLQPRQVDAPRGNVGGDTDARPAIPQRLQRVGAFLLAKLTGQRHDLKAPVAHAGHQVVHVHPRLAKDDGGLRFVEPQDVEDRVFPVAHGNRNRAVFDIDMLPRLTLRNDAQGVFLEGGCKLLDFLRHGGRKHQRAAFLGGGGKDELQILGKTQIQHLVGFVQHGGAQARKVKAAAFDMVAQPAGSAHDNMRPTVQRALFGAVVHAANAGGDLGPGPGIKPFQLARDLQGKLTRGGDGQGDGLVGVKEGILPAKDLGGDGKAEGYGLA